MSFFLAARRVAFIPLWVVQAAVAQHQHHGHMPPDAATVEVPKAPARPAGGYVSMFEGYQAFTDEETISWKQSNETVYRAGGWRAYAREAAQPHATPAPAPTAAPAQQGSKP